MKILFISKDYPPHLIGGVGIYVYEASRLLARAGHEVFVITKSDDSAVEYVDAGVRVYCVAPKKIKIWDGIRHNLPGFVERLEYSLAVSEKLKEILRDHKIDIIETSEARAEAFWYYFLHKRPPLLIKLHTPETVAFKLDHTPRTLDYRLIKVLEEFWVGKADQLVGLSQEVVDLTARHFSIKLKNLPLIPNPIDLHQFVPADTQPDNGRDILYVGRLEFRKGVHTLIRAFGYLEARVPGVTLTFIGADCGMKGYLLEKVNLLAHPENVQFIDQINRQELVRYYQKSTVCVIPSVWENYPYTCLEAMACAKAVVASDIGGLREMITSGSNGILFPTGSARSLSEALIALLNNAQIRKKLGVNARKTIEDRYASEKISQQAVAMYQAVIDRSKGARLN